MNIAVEDGQVVVTRPKRFKKKQSITWFNKNS